MSTSSAPAPNFEDLAGDLIRHCELAVDADHLETISESQLAGTITALLRVLAAKAQSNLPIRLAVGNSRLSATDAVIASTAILESAGIEVFELAAWQAMTKVGSSRRDNQYIQDGDPET